VLTLDDIFEIVRVLKEEDRLGKLKSSYSDPGNFMETCETINTTKKPEFNNISKENIFNKSNLIDANDKEIIKDFSELLDIINFISTVSTKTHGIFNVNEIIKIVIEEFKKSNKYTGSFLFLTCNEDKLRVVKTSHNDNCFRLAEKISGDKVSTFKINLKKSKIYSKVINEEKTICFNVIDLLNELFPKKIALAINKVLCFKNKSHIAAPLKVEGKIIGAFAMSSPKFADLFIPFIRTLAFHISYAFENSKHDFEKKIAEYRLSESRQEYINMIETAPFGILSVNQNGIVTSVNKKFIELTGFQKDELISKKYFDYPTIIKEDLPKHMQLFKSIIKGKIPESFEFRWIRKDGVIRQGRMYINLVKSGEELKAIQGVIFDITNEKKYYQKILESERKYRDLYERLRDGSATVNMQGKIIQYNSKFKEMLGYNDEEIVNLTYKDITPNKWHHYEDKIINGQVMKNGYSDLYEKEYIKKDGSVIPVEITTYLLKDMFGNNSGMWAIVRDITNRKKSEMEIKKSREYFQTLFNTIIDPLVIVDRKGIFLEVTEKVSEITGFSRDELIGKSFLTSKIVSRRTKAALIKNLIKRMAGKKIAPYEVEILTKDGRFLPFEINAAKIDYKGKPADMVVFRDISQRIKAEKQLKILNRTLEEKVNKRTAEVENLLKQKDEFINQLGHDLKNPLTPITVLLPKIIEKIDDPNNEERLQVVYRNVNYIKDLVVDTLKLARLNSSSTVLQMKDLNLLSLVNEVVLDNEMLLNQRNLHIENYIPDKIAVLADNLQLKEVLHNLTINAIKFMSDGGILEFDAVELEDQDFVRIMIRDNGMGMTKEQLEHVFEEFYKADISRHDLASSGLGLSISKRIVEKHGGKIWVESSGRDKGTSVYVTVPSAAKKTN
jgi:PAS domain S-box-containing protein